MIKVTESGDSGLIPLAPQPGINRNLLSATPVQTLYKVAKVRKSGHSGHSDDSVSFATPEQAGLESRKAAEVDKSVYSCSRSDNSGHSWSFLVKNGGIRRPGVEEAGRQKKDGISHFWTLFRHFYALLRLYIVFAQGLRTEDSC